MHSRGPCTRRARRAPGALARPCPRPAALGGPRGQFGVLRSGRASDSVGNLIGCRSFFSGTEIILNSALRSGSRDYTHRRRIRFYHRLPQLAESFRFRSCIGVHVHELFLSKGVFAITLAAPTADVRGKFCRASVCVPRTQKVSLTIHANRSSFAICRARQHV